MDCPQKNLKIELPDILAIAGYNEGTCVPIFIAASFTIAKLRKHPKCPSTDE
jgi:hypothetical protein